MQNCVDDKNDNEEGRAHLNICLVSSYATDSGWQPYQLNAEHYYW